MPAEAYGQAADGDDDALLPFLQLLAHRLPPQVKVPVLRSQRTSSQGKRAKTAKRERHMHEGVALKPTVKRLLSSRVRR